MNIGCHSDFMDKIIKRADKRQERMEKMINKILDKSEPILNAGKPKPMTNDEWRKTCSMEEFADFLFEKACYCSMCGDESQDTEEKIKSCPFGKTACVKNDWEMWLKQPHREE